MNDFVEQLESRTLFSGTAVAAAGSYTGILNPIGHASIIAFKAATGSKKSAVPATFTLAIAGNDIATGTLTLTGVQTYTISGEVLGATVSLTVNSGATSVGNFAGKLKALNRKLTGPLTDVINGQVVSGNLILKNDAAVKQKGGGSSNNLALAPGYTPNETPPSIGSGLNSGTSPGDQTGITGGNNAGTGIVGGDSGSLLG